MKQNLLPPMSERVICTSNHYPDCIDCALGAALGCIHFVQFTKSRNNENNKQKIPEK